MIVSMNRTRATRRAAFTLMEVLVVVAIVVILASVGTLATLKFLDDAKCDTARAGADNLQTCYKAWSVRHDGEELTDLSVLAEYTESGTRALYDPWNKMYQFTYKTDSATSTQRFFIYTTHPTKGEQLGSPKVLENQ